MRVRVCVATVCLLLCRVALPCFFCPPLRVIPFWWKFVSSVVGKGQLLCSLSTSQSVSQSVIRRMISHPTSQPASHQSSQPSSHPGLLCRLAVICTPKRKKPTRAHTQTHSTIPNLFCLTPLSAWTHYTTVTGWCMDLPAADMRARIHATTRDQRRHTRPAIKHSTTQTLVARLEHTTKRFDFCGRVVGSRVWHPINIGTVD